VSGNTQLLVKNKDEDIVSPFMKVKDGNSLIKENTCLDLTTQDEEKLNNQKGYIYRFNF